MIIVNEHVKTEFCLTYSSLISRIPSFTFLVTTTRCHSPNESCVFDLPINKKSVVLNCKCLSITLSYLIAKVPLLSSANKVSILDQ